MHLRALLIILALLAAGRFAHADPVPRCEEQIKAAQRSAGIPDVILRSIALVESGRRVDPAGAVRPWPWTINAEGRGRYFETKDEAIEAVRSLQKLGVRSIDVGCMQVNLLQHPSAFASLEEAFDPDANALYAAHFLGQLHSETGDWGTAIAAYHSRTPELGLPYERRVLGWWQPRLEVAPAWSSGARARAGYTPAFARERAEAQREWESRRARALAEFAELHGLAGEAPLRAGRVKGLLARGPALAGPTLVGASNRSEALDAQAALKFLRE